MNLNKDFTSWISAARLKTLPLAASNIILGSLLAVYYNSFNSIVFIFGLVTALLLQILSNFANDYGDFKSGADKMRNSTFERALQSGKIKPAQMKRTIIILSIITLISGIGLIISNPIDMTGFLVFISIGVLAIIAAITYTIGKNPYGYNGMGDIAVFLFFGIVGVCGIFYLHSHQFRWQVLLPAASLGLMSTGVLNINNIRDFESDQLSGKKTLVVRIGLTKAKFYHVMLLTVAFLLCFFCSIMNYHHYLQFLYLLTLPLFFKNIHQVYFSTIPSQFDNALRNLAITSFLFSLAYGIGILF